MKDKTKIKLAAIGAVTWLESLALVCGIDGTVLALAIGGICGLAGYVLREVRR